MARSRSRAGRDERGPSKIHFSASNDCHRSLFSAFQLGHFDLTQALHSPLTWGASLLGHHALEVELLAPLHEIVAVVELVDDEQAGQRLVEADQLLPALTEGLGSQVRAVEVQEI